MPRNVELRERVSGTFDNANSLLYPKTIPGMVVGLLGGDGKIAAGLIPDWLAGGTRFLGTYGVATATSLDILLANRTAFEALAGATWNAQAQTIAKGMYIQMTVDCTITLSTGHNLEVSDDGEILATPGQVRTIEKNDFLVIIAISGGTHFGSATTAFFSVINNTHGLATQTVMGLMSAADKTKLDGLSNWSQPAYTARSVDTSGIDVLDVFTSDATGHVTNITTRSLPTASTSVAGVMSAADKTKLDGLAIHPTDGANTGFTLNAAETIASITVNSLGHVTVLSSQAIRVGSTTQTGLLQLATGTELTTALSTAKTVTPSTVKGMIDYFSGLDRYADLATANAASHPDGAIVLVTVA